jgi:hypothetical protein
MTSGKYIGVKTHRGWLMKQIMSACKVPPEGWYCTRGHGHEGPCAAHQRTVIGYKITTVFEDEVGDVLVPTSTK